MAARGHRAEALVGLEQQAMAVGRADRQIDLEQLALVALEAVLGQREIADAGIDVPGSQRPLRAGGGRVARADQPRLVGVDDRAVRPPDLYPDHLEIQHTATDDPVDALARLGARRDERVVDGGLHHAGREYASQPLGVIDRLGLADATEDQRRDPGERSEGYEARGGKLEHLGGHRGSCSRAAAVRAGASKWNQPHGPLPVPLIQARALGAAPPRSPARPTRPMW